MERPQGQGFGCVCQDRLTVFSVQCSVFSVQCLEDKPVYQSFDELEVWKRACQLSVRIYELLRECREFGLRNQMQRAGVSIASNIAEGSERGGKDFIRYLSIARGSAAELRTLVYIAAKLGLIDRSNLNILLSELKEISKMLTGLAKALQSKVRQPKRKPNTEN